MSLGPITSQCGALGGGGVTHAVTMLPSSVRDTTELAERERVSEQ